MVGPSFIEKLPFVLEIGQDNLIVLLRVDWNTPVDKDFNITNDYRIQQSKKTIHFLVNKKKSKVIILSHRGRPKGTPNVNDSFKIMFHSIRSYFADFNFQFCEDILQNDLHKKIKELAWGTILLCENMRFYPQETSKDEKEREEFAQKLSTLADIYVNDAFGVAHRKHVSSYDLAKFLPSYSGFLLYKEIQVLNSILTKSKHPFILVIGGSKISTKIEMLESILEVVDTIIIGGGMAYTFLAAQGIPTGASIVEEKFIEQAKAILLKTKKLNKIILLPIDHTVTTDIQKVDAVQYSLESIPDKTIAVDIGEKTIALFKKALVSAKTVLWNGPMGIFEIDAFASGTIQVANLIGNVQGTTIIGGGDSLYAVKKAGVLDKISHLSTGGGATIDFLKKRSLPAIDILLK